jgi:hypothetical protein
MITAVLNSQGTALMGVDGVFVHFGGNYKVYRKPHSAKCRAVWAARWSTDRVRIKALESGFSVTYKGEDFNLNYDVCGFELLMYFLNKEPEYRVRKFSRHTSHIVSVVARLR